MGSDARSAGGALALLMLATFMGTGKATLSFSLEGETIQPGENILITRINPQGDNNAQALICRGPNLNVAGGNFYLHTTETTAIEYRVESADARGWKRNRLLVNEDTEQLVRLRRTPVPSSQPSVEGVVTCLVTYNSTFHDGPISIGVYYEVSVTATFNVISAREGLFTVTCRSTGGTVLRSFLTLPNGELNNPLQAVQPIVRRGSDVYEYTSEELSGWSHDDMVSCLASNYVIPAPNSHTSATLQVAGNPVLRSAVQVPPGNSIRVEWDRPTDGATVKSYIIHYQDDKKNLYNRTVPARDTSTVLEDLVNDGQTYEVSVEATSEHLSGESDTLTVELPLGSATNLSLLELPFKLELQWKAPHAIKGVVTGYQVLYWDANNTTARVMNVDGTSASVYGVETETEYVFNVVPNTKNRPGELATISITTSFQPEVFVQLRFTGVGNCMDWVHQQTPEKLSDVSDLILSDLQDVCDCDYRQSQIITQFFQCSEDAMFHDSVIYRAHLIPAPEVTASSIVSALSEWREGGRHVGIGGVALRTDTWCDVEIANLEVNECRPVIITTSHVGHVDAMTTPMTTPTEDSAGGGGHGLEGPLIGVGVVLLVISLLLIAVGIFLCARCIRSSSKQPVAMEMTRIDVKSVDMKQPSGQSTGVVTKANMSYEPTVLPKPKIKMSGNPSYEPTRITTAVNPSYEPTNPPRSASEGAAEPYEIPRAGSSVIVATNHSYEPTSPPRTHDNLESRVQ